MSEKKKTPKQPKVAPSPRASSRRAVRKRALWSEWDDGEGADDEEEGESELVGKSKRKITKKPKPQGQGQIKKPRIMVHKKQKKNAGLKKKGDQIKPWVAGKHCVVVGVQSFDKDADALVVNAKLSAHGRAKVHRVHVKPDVVDKKSTGPK